jgi:hypothetical protein
MNATARAAQGKAEFFDARTYMFHVTGFPHRRDVLVRPEDAQCPKVDGIAHYIRMRRDSARQQLNQLRKTMPRAADGDALPVTMEALPRHGELAAGQLRPQLAGRGYPAPAATAA